MSSRCSASLSTEAILYFNFHFTYKRELWGDLTGHDNFIVNFCH